jgi:broad specificity phosphatase PhoE
MNLYLVRHGQTGASRENRFSGSSDPPLTAVGEAMAQAFAQAYASLKWDAIYTSPMLRAPQTAEALCRLSGVQATVEDGLKEIDYGEWEGLRQDEVKERWPEAFEYWADERMWASLWPRPHWTRPPCRPHFRRFLLICHYLTPRFSNACMRLWFNPEGSLCRSPGN